jgi:Bacteriophage tail sheath protein
MTENDIASGIVTIVVGFAPLRPAEFVIVELRQRASQPES